MGTLLGVDLEIRPATPEDLPAVMDLVVAAENAELGYADYTADALQEDWAAPGFDLSRDSFVAWAGDIAVSYGMVRDKNGSGRLLGDHYARPGEEHWPAGREVLARMVARAGQMAMEAGHAEVAVTIGQALGAPFPTNVLPTEGWRIVRRFSRMARELSDVDDVEVPLPDGVRVRTVADEADRRSYHRIVTEAFADHWGSEAMTYAQFTEWLTTLVNNDWSLWRLAIDAEGADIGALRSRVNGPKVGYVDALAVLAPARGRGVGSALLRGAFAEFARRGYDRVELGVDTENVAGALRVYERAGMTPAFQIDVWEITVPAG